MDNSKTAEFLKALRKAKGLTQQDAADALYLSPKTISRWESGDGLPDINIIQSVADLYGVTVDEILRGERAASDPSEAIKADKIKNKRSRKALEATMYRGFWIFEIISLSIGVIIFLVGLILGFSGLAFVGIIVEGVGLATGVAVHMIGRYVMSPRIDDDDDDLVKEAKRNVFDKIRRDDFAMNMVYLGMAILLLITMAFRLFGLSGLERILFVVFAALTCIAVDLPLAISWKKKLDMRKAAYMSTAFGGILTLLSAVHLGIVWSDRNVLLQLVGPYTGYTLGMAVAIIGSVLEIAAIGLAIWKKWVLPLVGVGIGLIATRRLIQVPIAEGNMDTGGVSLLYYVFIIAFGILVAASLLTRVVSFALAKRQAEESSEIQ